MTTRGAASGLSCRTPKGSGPACGSRRRELRDQGSSGEVRGDQAGGTASCGSFSSRLVGWKLGKVGAKLGRDFGREKHDEDFSKRYEAVGKKREAISV